MKKSIDQGRIEKEFYEVDITKEFRFLIMSELVYYSEEGKGEKTISRKDIRKIFLKFGYEMSELELDSLILKLFNKKRNDINNKNSITISHDEVIKLFEYKFKKLSTKETVKDCFKIICDEGKINLMDMNMLLRELIPQHLGKDLRRMTENIVIDEEKNVDINAFVNYLY